MGRVATKADTVGTLNTGEPTADLRVDASGRLWIRPSLVAGAEAYASAAHTATENLAAVAVPDGASKLALFVDVTAVGGDANETLDIDVEWSPDAGTTWFAVETAQSFAQILQTGGADQNVCKQFAVMAPHYRLALTLAGTTPSFTFAVDHVGLYA